MKSNPQTIHPKFQSKQLFEKRSICKSKNIIKFILALLFVMTVNQIYYSRTNITSDICFHRKSYVISGNNAFFSLKSCQEMGINSAYFEIKNDYYNDEKLTSIFNI